MKKSYKIAGMHCTSCAMLIEGELEDRGARAACNYAKELVEVEFDPAKLTEEDIKKAVEAAGYTLLG